MSLARFSVQNPVAINLLMWLIIGAGCFFGVNLTREFFPPSAPEQIAITVFYPGATPAEIEKAVTRRIERRIEDIDDVEKIESRVFEGVSITIVTVERSVDPMGVLADIRGGVDEARPELPSTAEEPEVVLVRPYFPVISVAVSGEVPEERLNEVARRIQDDLEEISGVAQLAVSGLREREIWVEVDPGFLEEFGVTFEEVGRAVAGANLDFPGGSIKTARGTVGIRTVGETGHALEMEDFIVSARPGGGVVRLRDLSRVQKTFEDRVAQGRFDGKPAVTMIVFKTPEDDALEIAEDVRAYVEANRSQLGGAVQLDVFTDLTRLIRGRIDLMLRNGLWGLLFVGLALIFFLDLRVSFWVAVGLPISFLGTFVLMNYVGATINMISLFGLITVLGLIVDDAIVIGENVFRRRREGLSAAEAAIQGTDEVILPVTTAVLTTIAAFLPLAFIGGTIGTFLRQLPLVVISALTISLVEALLILPSHLGHPGHFGVRRLIPHWVSERAHRIGEAKQWVMGVWLPALYERLLRFCLRWRYVTLSAVLAVGMMVAGLLAGGIVPFVLIQETDAETIVVDVEMSAGTREELTAQVVSDLEEVCLREPEVARVTAVLGSSFGERGRDTAAEPATIGQLTIELHPAEERQDQGLRPSQDLIHALRRSIGTVPGAKRVRVSGRQAGPRGPGIELRVRGDDFETLRQAIEYIEGELRGYSGVTEIENDLKAGRLEFRLRLKDSARALGLSARDLALQVRHALFGFEVQRLQEDDQEVRVRVVLPEESRHELALLGRLRIETPEGNRIPLEEVADLTTKRDFATLSRVDGKRAVTILAEVDPLRGNLNQITSDLDARLADIGQRFPSTSIAFEGRRKETSESLGSLRVGFPVALFLIYAIIAVLFQSYLQPLLVMIAIPCALGGAIIGHLLTGYPFTLLSMIGGVALAGIVVNDSLILVDFINRERRRGLTVFESVVAGGRHRLRAILLTTITTMAGLAPLMAERSFQAQFLIPMAVSIVYGLAFATVLILIFLPVLYLILEDLLGHSPGSQSLPGS